MRYLVIDTTKTDIPNLLDTLSAIASGRQTDLEAEDYKALDDLIAQAMPKASGTEVCPECLQPTYRYRDVAEATSGMEQLALACLSEWMDDISAAQSPNEVKADRVRLRDRIRELLDHRYTQTVPVLLPLSVAEVISDLLSCEIQGEGFDENQGEEQASSLRSYLKVLGKGIKETKAKRGVSGCCIK